MCVYDAGSVVLNDCSKTTYLFYRDEDLHVTCIQTFRIALVVRIVIWEPLIQD